MAQVAAFTEHGGVGQEVRCGRNIHMAPRARRSDRLYRIDEPLRIGYGVQTGKGQIVLLRTIDVAESAVLYIRSRARWRHAWEKDSREVTDRSAVAYYGIGLAAVCRYIDAVVEAMHQQIEIDALRRLGFVGGNRCGGARDRIGVRWVVA